MEQAREREDARLAHPERDHRQRDPIGGGGAQEAAPRLRPRGRRGLTAGPDPDVRAGEAGVRCTAALEAVGIGVGWCKRREAGAAGDGRGFAIPLDVLEDRAVPAGGPPPLYPLVLAALSKAGLGSTLAHRSLGLVFGA